MYYTRSLVEYLVLLACRLIVCIRYSVSDVCRYYVHPSKAPGTIAKRITLRSVASLCHVPSLRVNHLATNTPSLSVPLSGSRCTSLTVAAFMFLASYVRM